MKILNLQKTIATKNAYYIVHIIFRNIPAKLKDFNNCFMNMYKLRIK